MVKVPRSVRKFLLTMVQAYGPESVRLLHGLSYSAVLSAVAGLKVQRRTFDKMVRAAIAEGKA